MAGPSLHYLKEELSELERAGTAFHARVLQLEQRARTRFDGRDVINLASNNYLGLAAHPRMKAAAAKAAARFGAGAAAGRIVAGTMNLHLELEDRFAGFKAAEAAIMLQSGFTANSGTVAAILGRDDVIVSDELNHASIIDGARLSRAAIKVFPHKDVEAAERLLKQTKAVGRRQLLITDGVFSMDGDIAPLPDLVDVATKHEAIMMLDDAHATGVLGKNGRGTANHFGLHEQVDIQVGTLSKAIGVLGGFVAGPKHLIGWLANRSRPFVFSTSAPPAVVAACIEALNILEESSELVEQLWERTRFFKKGLEELGLDTGQSETPIIPIIVGEETKAHELARLLWSEGVFTPAIVYPAVPKGRARIRTIVTAEHRLEDLWEAIQAFARVRKKLNF